MSVCNADPWQVTSDNSQQQNGNIEESAKFEENFNPEKIDNQKIESNEILLPSQIEPLPDSANYLQLLERKLQKVQKGAKLLDSLQQKKEDCMRSLLATNELPATTIEQLLGLDTPIESGRLHRHLLPIQAVTVGETLHIVKHDALEADADVDAETNEEDPRGEKTLQ